MYKLYFNITRYLLISPFLFKYITQTLLNNCRYPYEYNPGNIKNSEEVSRPLAIRRLKIWNPKIGLGGQEKCLH